MDLQISHQRDYTLLKVSGNVERMPDCNKLYEEMLHLVNEKIPHIVLDLSNTDFVSSSFCGFLGSAVKKGAKKPSIFSVIVSEKSATNEVFNIAGIDMLVPIYHSMEEFQNKPRRKSS